MTERIDIGSHLGGCLREAFRMALRVALAPPPLVLKIRFFFEPVYRNDDEIWDRFHDNLR